MTKPDRRFTASPLFQIGPRKHDAVAIDLATSGRYASMSLQASRLLLFAIEPCTATSAIAAGFSNSELDQAFDSGLLVWEDDPRFPSMKLWEEHHWSRAANIIMSQFDLQYLEEQWPTEFATIVSGRRKTIEMYQAKEAYPSRHTIECLEEIALPKPRNEPMPGGFQRMFARRSVRTFARDAMSIEAFSAILHEATRLVRIADQSKAIGDTFFLLNSFYTWLDVYVAVQGVASLRRGIYRYGVERHALQPIAYDTSDEEISTVIQGQDWISGGGFCVFVVVDWARYMWLYRHSRAYLNLLIQLGEFSQEVIQKASLEGYGGWMTPAIREDAAAVLLNLDSLRYDAMHFLKIGIPQHDARREDSTDTTEGGPSV